jgi:hypothetical protein
MLSDFYLLLVGQPTEDFAQLSVDYCFAGGVIGSV